MPIPLSENTTDGTTSHAPDAPGASLNALSPGSHRSGEESPSSAQQEMLCAMHELTDALLNLNEHLRSLSTMLLEDVAVAEEKSRLGILCVSDYKAAGAPFGPDAEARSMWHLFRQATTDN